MSDAVLADVNAAATPTDDFPVVTASTHVAVACRKLYPNCDQMTKSVIVHHLQQRSCLAEGVYDLCGIRVRLQRVHICNLVCMFVCC